MACARRRAFEHRFGRAVAQKRVRGSYEVNSGVGGVDAALATAREAAGSSTRDCRIAQHDSRGLSRAARTRSRRGPRCAWRCSGALFTTAPAAHSTRTERAQQRARHGRRAARAAWPPTARSYGHRAGETIDRPLHEPRERWHEPWHVRRAPARSRRPRRARSMRPAWLRGAAHARTSTTNALCAQRPLGAAPARRRRQARERRRCAEHDRRRRARTQARTMWTRTAAARHGATAAGGDDDADPRRGVGASADGSATAGSSSSSRPATRSARPRHDR